MQKRVVKTLLRRLSEAGVLNCKLTAVVGRQRTCPVSALTCNPSPPTAWWWYRLPARLQGRVPTADGYRDQTAPARPDSRKYRRMYQVLLLGCCIAARTAPTAMSCRRTNLSSRPASSLCLVTSDHLASLAVAFVVLVALSSPSSSSFSPSSSSSSSSSSLLLRPSRSPPA